MIALEESTKQIPLAQIKVKEKLVLLLDEFIMLTENEAWIEVSQQHSDLEVLRQQTVQAADRLWFAYRNAING